MRKRLVSAAVLIPIVVAAVYLGGPYLAGLAGLVAVLAVYEYQRLVSVAGARAGGRCRACFPVGALTAVLLVADGQWPRIDLGAWGVMTAVLGLLIVGVLREDATGALHGWAHSVTGALYVGMPLGVLVRLRNLPNGLYWVLLVCIGTWMCDAAALVVGKTWGKRAFSPAISPSKTWEGALGGEIVGAVSVMACAMVFPTRLAAGPAAALGLLIPTAAILGDLAESLIKRQIGVKDSGHLIPGHGGMLDRIDSLLFTGPVVYAFIQFFM